MIFLVAKVLHFVGVISWFAGLFYLVRLFIYHAEAGEREDPKERDLLQAQFDKMSGRLWTIITMPAMLLTLAGGTTMVVLLEGIPSWLHIKFGFLALLLVYHFQCGRLRKQQLARTCDWSPKKLRVFNEGATLLMVAIVTLAVMKTALSAIWGMLSLLVVGLSLMMGIRLYAKFRKS